MAEYTPSELMTVNAARQLRDQDVVMVGVGLPNLACNLARRTHAPNLVMIYEAGVIGAQPARLPLSIGDPTLVSGAVGVCTFFELFSFFLQRGYVNVGFMGGAQIDRLGNVNATVIGDYAKPGAPARFGRRPKSRHGPTAAISSPPTRRGDSRPRWTS
jgi:glutaconate CoA-transferase subunit B